MVKCNCNNQFNRTDKTRQKENRSEKVSQTKTETVKERGGNSPDLVSLVCVGCVLAFTIFSEFRLIVLIISAVAATSALVMAIKNRKDYI